MTGPLHLEGSPPLQIAAGASAGYVLTSDGSGNAAWAAPSAPGVVTVSDQTARDALVRFTGLCVWRVDLKHIESWDGSEWVVVGPQNAIAYAHDEGGVRTISTTASFLDFTGQPSVTVTVPASGILKVEWGFVGYNNASETATIRLSPAMSGANTVSPSITYSASAAGGASTTPPRSASRARLYTGLNPGSTIVKLQARLSSGSSSTHSIQDSWLIVEPRA